MKSRGYKALVIGVSNSSAGIRKEEMDHKVLKVEGFPDVIQSRSFSNLYFMAVSFKQRSL